MPTPSAWPPGRAAGALLGRAAAPVAAAGPLRWAGRAAPLGRRRRRGPSTLGWAGRRRWAAARAVVAQVEMSMMISPLRPVFVLCLCCCLCSCCVRVVFVLCLCCVCVVFVLLLRCCLCCVWCVLLFVLLFVLPAVLRHRRWRRRQRHGILRPRSCRICLRRVRASGCGWRPSCRANCAPRHLGANGCASRLACSACFRASGCAPRFVNTYLRGRLRRPLRGPSGGGRRGEQMRKRRRRRGCGRRGRRARRRRAASVQLRSGRIYRGNHALCRCYTCRCCRRRGRRVARSCRCRGCGCVARNGCAPRFGKCGRGLLERGSRRGWRRNLRIGRRLRGRRRRRGGGRCCRQRRRRRGRSKGGRRGGRGVCRRRRRDRDWAERRGFC